MTLVSTLDLAIYVVKLPKHALLTRPFFYLLDELDEFCNMMYLLQIRIIFMWIWTILITFYHVERMFLQNSGWGNNS